MGKGPSLSIVSHIVSFLQKGTAGYNVFSRPLTPQYGSIGLGSMLEVLEKSLNLTHAKVARGGTSLLTRVHINGGCSPMLATQNLWHL